MKTQAAAKEKPRPKPGPVHYGKLRPSATMVWEDTRRRGDGLCRCEWNRSMSTTRFDEINALSFDHYGTLFDILEMNGESFRFKQSKSKNNA